MDYEITRRSFEETEQRLTQREFLDRIEEAGRVALERDAAMESLKASTSQELQEKQKTIDRLQLYQKGLEDPASADRTKAENYVKDLQKKANDTLEKSRRENDINTEKRVKDVARSCHQKIAVSYTHLTLPTNREV